MLQGQSTHVTKCSLKHLQNFDPLSVVIISGFYSQFTCDVEIHMNIFDNSRQYIVCVPVILFIAKQAFLRFRVSILDVNFNYFLIAFSSANRPSSK